MPPPDIVARGGASVIPISRMASHMPTADPGNHNLVAGEEWRIVGTLLDREGNPLDLTDAVIGWALLDQGGALVRANARMAYSIHQPPASSISS